MPGNDHALIGKLDEFIRKYHKNQLIRGLLLSIGLWGGLYLVDVLLEYMFRFGHNFRSILLYSYFAIVLISFVFWILVPLLKFLKIRGCLSYEQAARLIGSHFPVIEDKILNTLQLMSLKETPGMELDLIIAGIDQKIKLLKPFAFARVIDYRKNLRYLRYAVPPVLVILAGLAIAPSVVSDPAERILKYNQVFIPELPFSVAIENKELKALQQDDFELLIRFSGEEIPSEVFVGTEGVVYKMSRGKGFQYSHLFKSVQSDIRFRIIAGPLETEEFLLKVFPKPIILEFEVVAEYPPYTGKSLDVYRNTGDFTIPEGTRLTWKIQTRDVNDLWVNFSGNRMKMSKTDEDSFSFTQRILEQVDYSLIPSNQFSSDRDSMNFRLLVIKDGFPSVVVEQSSDSAVAGTLFFRGIIKDDYGFSRLDFVYEEVARDDTTVLSRSVTPLKIEAHQVSQVFYHLFDLYALMGTTQNDGRLYFEVWDNDGVNGPKRSRSDIRYFKTPTEDDLLMQMSENDQQIQKDLFGSMQQTQSIKNSIDDLNKKMVEQNSLNWQEKKKIEDILKANEKIVESIEQIKEKNLDNLNNTEKLSNANENILEKQRRLNELMDQLLTDEMKKTLQEIRDMLNQVDKAKMNSLLEKMKMTTRDLEQQLDRNLQLFKQLEFDRKLSEMIDKLRESAEEQRRLAEESNKGALSPEMIDKQKDLKDKYDSIKDALSDLREQEKDLETPIGIDKTQRLQDSISSGMKDSEEMMKQGKSKQAGSKQKKTGNQMDQLAQQLETMANEAEMEQMGEDAAAIRQILENLLRMSFEQEELIGLAGKVNRNDPKYQDIIVHQRDIRDKLQSAEDSLIEIAKRQFLLAPVINREINLINKNIEEVTTALNTRSVSVAMAKQQFAMTSMNNLALMLEESLKQMNMNMQNCMGGKGQKLCQNPSAKPGGSKAMNIRQMQQQLSDQLSKMKQGLEKQKGEQGKSGRGQQGELNEQVARLAAQQEAIRNELRKYQEELNEQGIKDGTNMSGTMSEMEQLERDLINKRVTQETLLRQQRIISRLLESEKAEQVREKEEKRESREQKEQFYRNFTGDFKYNKSKLADNELIHYKTPPLNLFYRNRTSGYMIKIGQ